MTHNPLKSATDKIFQYVALLKAYNQKYYNVMAKVELAEQLKREQEERERAVLPPRYSQKWQAIGIVLMGFALVSLFAFVTVVAWASEGTVIYPWSQIAFLLGIISVPCGFVGFIVATENGIFRGKTND